MLADAGTRPRQPTRRMLHGLLIRELALKLHPHSIRLAGLLICLTPVAAAVAQTVQPDAVEPALQIAAANLQDEPYRVVVTGARAPMPLKDTPQRIEVVTRQEIERTPHRYVADLLSKTTNVNVKRYPGMLGSISMRGYEAKEQMTGGNMQTLVLQNGIPAIQNNVSFLPTNGLARVEVLKGPSSALYGGQAMSGVINLIPVRRTGEMQGGVGLEYGSFNSRQVQADIGGALSSQLNMDYFGSWEKQGDFKSGNGDKQDNSSYTQHSHALRLGVELAPGWSLDARADLFRGDDVENPGGSYGEKTVKDVERDLYSVMLTGEVGKHSISASMYKGAEDYTTRDIVGANRPLSFDSKIDWEGLQLKDVWQWNDNLQLVYGLDYNKTHSSSMTFIEFTPPTWEKTYGIPGRYNPDSELKSTGLYAQANMKFNEDRTNFYLGGRYDRLKLSTLETDYLPSTTPESRSFSQFSPSMGVKHYLNPEFALHATMGKGFSAPSPWYLSGEYSSIYGQYIGNPGLKPESSRSVDAGISLEKTDWNLDLTFYDTRIKDKIIPDYTRPDGKSSWVNSSRARMQGVEVSGNWGISENILINAGYTHNFRAESEANGLWKDLEYVSKDTAHLAIYGGWGKIKTHIGARYNGEAIKDKKQRPGYTLWDAGVAYQPQRNQTLSLTVTNLFDKQYEDVVGYAMPGRSIKVGYRWDFK